MRFQFPKAIAAAAAALGLSPAQQLALDAAFAAKARDEGEPSGEQDYQFNVGHLSAAYDAVGELLDGARKGAESDDAPLNFDDETRERLAMCSRAFDCIARGKYGADAIELGTKKTAEIHGTGGRPAKDGPACEVARGDKKRASDSRPRFANDASRRATDHVLARASDGRTGPSSPFFGVGDYTPGCVDPNYSIGSIFKRE